MTRLIDELLDTSRISQGKVSLRTECLDLVTLVRQAVAAHRFALEQNGLSLEHWNCLIRRLRFLPTPSGYPQVIGNLLHNAAKFTDAGGQVTVGLRLPINDHRQAIVRGVGYRKTGMEPGNDRYGVRGIYSGPEHLQAAAEDGLGLGLAAVTGPGRTPRYGTVEAHSDGLGRELDVFLDAALSILGWNSPRPTKIRLALIKDRTLADGAYYRRQSGGGSFSEHAC